MTHEQFMHEAIAEALGAKGETGENPIVGAVIVEDGKIVARGHHRFFGGPHAEVEVLKALGRKPALNAVLYVTLEPCSTIGKTGKCTDVIVASGIRKVVVGAIDPNPKHRGQGVEILRKAGIDVTAGILAEECKGLNPEFNGRMLREPQATGCEEKSAIRGSWSESPVLFDTHCHLYYKDFDHDRTEMFARADRAGVKYFLNVGVNLAVSKICLEYAEKYSNVYASAGVHPTEAHKATDEDICEIEKLLGHPKVAAIGEVGLDFYHQDAPKEAQEKVFIRFLDMQQRVKKPLIIHARDSFDRLLEMLRSFGKAPYSGVFHCFTGDRAVMRQCLDLGFHISFAGILTYKKNDELRACAAECPEDRILVETDCPYLPPQSMRGKRNEPALMLETARAAAEAKGVSFEDFARQSTENALKLFRLKSPT